MDPKPITSGLYLVATPIGNLEDITLRALRVLEQVDKIACEDTRQTGKLLNHFNLHTPTLSYHLFNESPRAEQLVAELKAGAKIAIVSDAGTPGVADPGTHLVRAAILAGVPVFPVPGANAAISALIASGLDAETFTFHGFLPSKSGQRRTELEALPLGAHTHIFYETPHRILEALEDIATLFGPRQHVVVARELTKIHEEFLRGAVSEVRQTLAARSQVRGEMVLLFNVPRDKQSPAITSIREAVETMQKQEGIPEKDALKRIARDRNLSKSEAYRELQRSKPRVG